MGEKKKESNNLLIVYRTGRASVSFTFFEMGSMGICTPTPQCVSYSVGTQLSHSVRLSTVSGLSSPVVGSRIIGEREGEREARERK